MRESAREPVFIRPLEERDLEQADHIFRLAFGTFLGVPDPASFLGDAQQIRPRWLANPAGALAAEVNGVLAGSNFVTRWGSVGFLGPLTVHPSLWDRGIANKLMEATVEVFERWQVTLAGLRTFAHSLKHITFYQKFNFWPRFLTMLMAKSIQPIRTAALLIQFSQLGADERLRVLGECREITGAVHPGLDVTGEINAVDAHHLGDTVLIRDNLRLTGFAVCHCGAGSEAGSGSCYIKFGVVRHGASAPERFLKLLQCGEEFAARAGATQLIAGVNTGRVQAYRYMLARGFQPGSPGVLMQRADETGYNHEGVYVLDDWR